MRTKDPMRSKRVEDLREIAFYWRDECLYYFIKQEAMSRLLTSKGIDTKSNDSYNLFCSVQEDAKKKFWNRYVSFYKKEQLESQMRHMNFSQRTQLIENEMNKFFYSSQSRENLC